MAALRAHKHINIRQFRERDSLAAIGAGERAYGISLRVLSFRMYGQHGAIVARAEGMQRHSHRVELAIR